MKREGKGTSEVNGLSMSPDQGRNRQERESAPNHRAPAEAGTLMLPPRPLDEPLLRQFQLFKSFSSSELAELISQGKVFPLKEGEELRTPPGYIYVLLEGTVLCTIRDAAETVHVLAEKQPGYLCGELSALLQRSSSDHRVELITKSACMVARFPEDVFLKYSLPEGSAAATIALGLAESISGMNQLYTRAIDVRSDPAKVPGQNLGERLADLLKNKIGTWRFITGFGIFIGVYVGINAILPLLGLKPWDRYPHIFLNLLLSLASAATIPILLISQKRQAELDSLVAQATRRLIHKTQTSVRVLSREIMKVASGVGRVELQVSQLLEEVADLKKQLGELKKNTDRRDPSQ